MKNKPKNPAMDAFFESVLALESVKECYAFFEDVCTVNELNAMAQRFQVALMLYENRTYVEIGEATGASTATISRVNRSLQYGKEGYKLVIDRQAEQKKSNQESGV